MWACLASLAIPAGAQDADNNIRGMVVDKWGHPVYGASVMVKGMPETRVETDKDGKFSIEASAGQQLNIVSVDKGMTTVKAEGKSLVKVVLNYADVEPTFYVRGLQSLSSSSPLILVDGLERDMSLLSSEEVESVSVLKDAAAVALYGYKGINGAILITTKRGKYNSKEIRFTYDHVNNYMNRKPEFVDASTYAQAYNEACGYEGLSPRYATKEVEYFRNGEYPYL